MKSVYLLFFSLFLSASLFAQWTDDVTDNVHVANTDASDIQSVGTTGGKTWIAYYSLENGNYNMRAQLLDSTGKRLLGNNGVLVDGRASGSATFVFNITTNGQGDLLIGHQIEFEGNMTAVVSRIDQSGNSVWGSGVTLGEGLSPYPAFLSSGETVVVWNKTSTNTLNIERIAADGTPRADSTIDIKIGSSNTTRGQVVANENGTFTLVFQKAGFGINTTLYAQRYSRYLKKLWSAPKQLGSGSTSAARYYSVAAERDTTYVGYYSSVEFRFNAFLQRINPDEANALPYGDNGTAFSTDTATNDNYQQTITITFKDSSETVWSVCTYSDPNQVKYGVYAQQFLKATGERLFGDKAKKVYAVSNHLDQQVGELQLTGNDVPGFLSTDVSNLLYVTKLENNGNIDTVANKKVLGGTSNVKSRFCFAANDVLAVAVWAENRGNGDRPFAQNVTAYGVTGVLPVIISNFKAVKNGSVANLSWTTLTETNNNGFYIERSADGTNFTSLGFVAGKSSIAGEGNHYLFTDVLPLAKNNYYRLQQADDKGNVTYSETLLLSFASADFFTVVKLYPNPAKNVLNAQVQSQVSGTMMTWITNSAGTVIRQQSINIVQGTQVMLVAVNALPKGIYYLKVSLNGIEKTIPFTKL